MICRRSDSTPLETASFRLPKTVREWLAWRAERNGISRSRLVTLTLERAMRYDREWKSSIRPPRRAVSGAWPAGLAGHRRSLGRSGRLGVRLGSERVRLPRLV